MPRHISKTAKIQGQWEDFENSKWKTQRSFNKIISWLFIRNHRGQKVVSRFLYPATHCFKNKGNIKIVADEQKLKEIVMSRLAQEEIIK